MIPLQYVIAEELVLPFRVAKPFGFKGSGFWVFFPFHCQQTHSPLRARPSAVHQLYVLSRQVTSTLKPARGWPPKSSKPPQKMRHSPGFRWTGWRKMC